jgi:hypothetical protein
MFRSFMKPRHILTAAAILAAGTLLAGPLSRAAGETFFEPPGSKHLVSENASATAPASLLAIFVADDGVQLTIYE